jgi:hypothetical protein
VGMADIHTLEFKSDVKEVVETYLSVCEKDEAVIILSINKEGCPYLRTNRATLMQKSFMIQFLNAYMYQTLVNIDG